MVDGARGRMDRRLVERMTHFKETLHLHRRFVLSFPSSLPNLPLFACDASMVPGESIQEDPLCAHSSSSRIQRHNYPNENRVEPLHRHQSCTDDRRSKSPELSVR